MNSRLDALNIWTAKQLSLPLTEVAQNMTDLAGDASFRRYYRLKLPNSTYVLMDAPPETESTTPFIAFGQALADIGLSVPEIIAADQKQGFLLLSDLGDDLYFKILTPKNSDELYQQALDALVIMQTCPGVRQLKMGSYDTAMYTLELERVVFWFFEQYLQLTLTSADRKMLNKVFELLINSALAQPQVFTHRDYHSRNLLWLPQKATGIIDFQDSVWGAVTYDAVSLLRDCYISWPQDRVTKWALEFKEKAWAKHQFKPVSDRQFMRWFDLMGVQRHLKATYIFARKFCRDGQTEYLKDVPQTLNYVIEVSKNYSELSELRKFILNTVQPRWEQLK